MTRPFTTLMSALPLLAVTLATVLLAAVPARPGEKWAYGGQSRSDPHTKTDTNPWAGIACDSLDVCVDGKSIHLLIGDNGAEGKSPVFRHSRSDDGGNTWSAPVLVSGGARQPVPHHRGSDATIIARGDRLFAAWTTPGTGFKGTGPMGTALSTDGGKTWRPGPDPSDLKSTGSHRFLALAADDKAIHLVWLDDRDNLRGLRHASSIDGGKTWSANVTVDDFTCACCWNTIIHVPGTATNPAALFVLYRDMKPSDMGLARSGDGGKTWEKLGHVGEFAWEFNGCPHVGGGLALGESSAGVASLFAAVWTGQPGRIGCHLIASDVKVTAWMPVRRLGDDTARHPTLAASEKHIAIGYDDLAGDDRATFALTSKDGGKTWSSPRRLSPSATQGTHVRLVAVPGSDRFLALWTESVGKGPSILRIVPL
jgi:hypothetical protein